MSKLIVVSAFLMIALVLGSVTLSAPETGIRSIPQMEVLRVWLRTPMGMLGCVIFTLAMIVTIVSDIRALGRH